MKIGYARISKGDAQSLAGQHRALKKAGAKKIYSDKASGGTMERAQLRRAMASLRKGDVLLVWKLDRLGRSLSDLLALLGQMASRGAGFASLTEPIDTTTAGGRMLLHMLGAFAEFERGMIRERVRLGLDTAKRNGVKLGRRPKARPDQARYWAKGVERGDVTVQEAAHGLDVSRRTMHRILARYREQIGVDHDKEKSPTRKRAEKIASRFAARRRVAK